MCTVEGQQASDLLAVNTGVFIFFPFIDSLETKLTYKCCVKTDAWEGKKTPGFSLSASFASKTVSNSPQPDVKCFTNVKEASAALQGIILKRELPVKYENPLQLQEIALDFLHQCFGHKAD